MREKNAWVLLMLLLAGVVLGGFVGSLAETAPMFSWLGFGESFGLASPLVLNLGILEITFGFSLRITVSGLIGMALAVLVYRWL